MTALEEARQRFVRERPGYELLVAEIEAEVGRALQLAGIAGQVAGRAKDVSSFVSKSFRKGYQDPWAQATDKAGVRVTVDRVASIDPVVALLHERYTLLEVQDKRRDLLHEDKIGYMGVHVQVEVTAADSVVRQCEIQVRTAAQGLWAEMSHELLYKPESSPDAETRRALIRLATFMELFDEEVARRVTQLTAAPGYPLDRLIATAERHYYRFAVTRGDRVLSQYVLDVVGPALPPGDDVDGYANRLAAFVDTQSGKLDELYERYRHSNAVFLLTQPESIVLLERLDDDPFTLAEVWSRSLPPEELEALASAWGGPL